MARKLKRKELTLKKRKNKITSKTKVTMQDAIFDYFRKRGLSKATFAGCVQAAKRVKPNTVMDELAFSNYKSRYKRLVLKPAARKRKTKKRKKAS